MLTSFFEISLGKCWRAFSYVLYFFGSEVISSTFSSRLLIWMLALFILFFSPSMEYLIMAIMFLSFRNTFLFFDCLISRKSIWFFGYSHPRIFLRMLVKKIKSFFSFSFFLYQFEIFGLFVYLDPYLLCYLFLSNGWWSLNTRLCFWMKEYVDSSNWVRLPLKLSNSVELKQCWPYKKQGSV